MRTSVLHGFSEAVDITQVLWDLWTEGAEGMEESSFLFLEVIVWVSEYPDLPVSDAGLLAEECQ